jgi:polygalacturonase
MFTLMTIFTCYQNWGHGVLVLGSGGKEMVSEDVVMVGPEVTEPGKVEHVEVQVLLYLI